MINIYEIFDYDKLFKYIFYVQYKLIILFTKNTKKIISRNLRLHSVCNSEIGTVMILARRIGTTL